MQHFLARSLGKCIKLNILTSEKEKQKKKTTKCPYIWKKEASGGPEFL